MKKTTTFLLCLLLVLALAVPALAADAVTVTLTPDSAVVRAGDELNITVSVGKVEGMTSMGCIPDFDETVFQLVYGECLVTIDDGGNMMGFDIGEPMGQFMLDGSSSFQGEVFRYMLKVRENAPVGRYTLGGKMPVRNGQGHLAVTVEEAVVTVVSKEDAEQPTTPVTEAPKTDDQPGAAVTQPAADQGGSTEPKTPADQGSSTEAKTPADQSGGTEPKTPADQSGTEPKVSATLVTGESAQVPAEDVRQDGAGEGKLTNVIILWCVLVAAAILCLAIRSMLRKKRG